MLRDLVYRLRALFRRNTVEGELDDELRFHFDRQVEKYLKSGFERAEAVRKARLVFGGLDQVKEECRQARGLSAIETTIQDLRYTFRVWRKRPLSALLVMLSLALGIGATSAIFSLVYAMLVDPFPYRDPAHIAGITFTDEGGHSDTLLYPVSGYLELRRNSTTIDDAFAVNRTSMIATKGLPETVTALAFSPNAFQFLGVPAVLGRTFAVSDIPSPAAPPRLAVISYSFWRRYFAADDEVVGRTLELNHESFTITGVASPRFTWSDADVFVPLQLSETGSAVNIFVRPKAGLGLEGVSAELDTITHRLTKASPGGYPRRSFRIRALSLSDLALGRTARTLSMLLIAAGFLLAIACANVSILLLARATIRKKEIALRISLGASPGRVIQQLLTESVVLSLAGGILGLLLSSISLRPVIALMPAYTIPHEMVVRMNPQIVFVTFVVCVVTGILFGFVPALELARADVSQAMQDSGNAATGVQKGGRTRNMMIIGEVALTVVLLTGAGTAIRGLVALHQIRLGYDPSNVMVVNLPIPPDRYKDWGPRGRFFESVLDQLKIIPGVQSVAATGNAVPPITDLNAGFEIAGETRETAGPIQVGLIGGEYFSVLRIPLLRGRLLTQEEITRGDDVAVVNDEMARRFWPPGHDPLGARVHVPVLKFNNPDILIPPAGNQWFRLVGIVGTALNQGLRGKPAPSIYVSYKLALIRSCEFLIRTEGDPHRIIHTMREKIHDIEPDQPVTGALTLDERLDSFERAFPRFIAVLFGLFAGVALALAATGLYSVISYTVSRRTHELGIRMALGAHRIDVLAMVLRGAIGLVSVGLVIGLITSVIVMRVIARFLSDWNPTDPLAFGEVVLVFIATGLVAAWFPARRATRIDPMVALRHE